MSAISNILKIFLVCFAVNIILLEVHSYPKDFSVADNYEDYTFEHDYSDQYYHEDSKPDVTSTLVLSHVIFRHGNRTPDSFKELYPNDPYLNETYYPYGLGQLTNAGKLREYKIGTTLRQRYRSFLNDMFLPEEVEAISTDYNRTKASLELALAGLFLPRSEQIWNQALMWQPVPYNFVSRNQDTILLGVLCPNYLSNYGKVQTSLMMKNEYKKFQKIFSYVSWHSGLNVTTFQDIYNLYFGLSTEEENGLTLPDWTRRVWPNSIINLSIREYYVSMANNDLRKMASGYFLKKILDNTLYKITQTNNKKKIYLYSAHENNLAQFLILLDVFRPHIPNYGAHVIVEVHKINGIFGIKVFYQNWETQEPELLKIPNCEEFCPLKKFIKLFSKYIPEDNLCGN